jgi:FkbM family methyltransferase
MLMQLNQILSEYKLEPRGVLHIGAFDGREHKEYRATGIQNMIFFEPVKDNYSRLLRTVPKRQGIQTYNIALGNETCLKEMYVEKVKGQSCSFLEPGTHLQLHPHIKFSGKETVGMTKLDSIAFDRSLFNMINIDVQGYELEVFKGAVETLKTIDIIYTEVNFEEVYKGCCKIEELDAFLKPFGFNRVFTKDSKASKERETWGDALYIKQQTVVNFEESHKSSYCYNEEKYTTEQPKWELLKALYQKNFIETNDRDYRVLPRKIHQIWLGGDPLPFHKKLAESWQKFNPDWEYKLWTDADVDSILPDRTMYDSMTNFGHKSDLLRYYILCQHGGLYIDTDFECLKSFDDFTYLNFLMGVGYPSKVEFYNALIACTPGHPILINMIQSITTIGSGGARSVFATTGNYLFTEKFFEVVTQPVDGVLIMPTDYFYPYSNKPGFEIKSGRKYIKPCSYAIHYWELLWIKAHRKYVYDKQQIRSY